MTIIPLNGQSNIDICLSSLGSLDSYISFLSKNSISETSKTKDSEYLFSNSDIKNKLLTGYDYSTGTNTGKFFDPSFFDPTFFE